jgi:glutamate dehydrogenase (NADP+)
LKFLGFEQTLKNALTGLPMGGGKGGSDFDPKGKSDLEVMRFCHAFMLQLRTHIGPDTDVPAGDIGVGGREIGYLFGMYKKLSREFHGVLTGKGVCWGGSEMRTEATGYGLIFYLREMLKEREIPLEEAAALISGSGNVAIHAAEKLMELGGKVLSLSDSKGYIHVPEGLTEAQLKWIKDLKFNKRGRISEAADKFDGIKFYKRKDDDSIGVWGIEGANIALPCATQNELNEDAAQALVSHSVTVVAEGANMPCTSEAVEVFRSKKVMYAPGKASNAGGVATSGLEMQQNAMHSHWKRKEVADKLEEIMVNIYRLCSDTAKEYDREGDLAFGANIAGFLKTADAMISEGVV